MKKKCGCYIMDLCGRGRGCVEGGGDDDDVDKNEQKMNSGWKATLETAFFLQD